MRFATFILCFIAFRKCSVEFTIYIYTFFLFMKFMFLGVQEMGLWKVLLRFLILLSRACDQFFTLSCLSFISARQNIVIEKENTNNDFC